MRLLLRRLAAFALDCALLFAVLAPLGYAIQAALDVTPETPREIYRVLVLNFSLPVWTYFALCDAAGGATVGRRAMGLRAVAVEGGSIPAGRAWLRTAVKLLPWETTHAAFFLIPESTDAIGPASWILAVLADAAAVAWVVVAARRGGARGVHDLAAGTRVERAG